MSFNAEKQRNREAPVGPDRRAGCVDAPSSPRRVKLGEVCEEISERNRDSLIQDVCSVTNSSGFIASEEYFDKKVFSKDLTTYKIVRMGMFAYNPSRINVGSVACYSGKGPVVVSPLYIVFKIDGGKILNGYLSHFIKSPIALRQISGLTTGSVRDSLKFKSLCDITIPLPPLPAQRAIAAELDRICELKKTAEKLVEKLQLLVKSRFVEMFGEGLSFPKATIDDMCELITDGEHATPRRCDKGVLLLSARNVHDHRLLLDDVDYIDKDEYDRIAKRIVPRENDILLSCSGSVGRCCVVPPNLKFQLVRSVALLRFKSDVVPLFAEHLLCSPQIQRQIDSLKTASSQANLFQGKIKKLVGFIPPLSLQREFAAFVAKVDKLEFAAREAVKKLDVLYRSRLQEHFS